MMKPSPAAPSPTATVPGLKPFDIWGGLGGLLENPAMSDITFRVVSHANGGALCTIPAHRLVLSLRGAFPMVAAAVADGRHASSAGVEVMGVDPGVFRLVLRYCYTDDVPPFTSTGGCLALLRAASRFELGGLLHRCAGYLLQHLDEGNVCPVLQVLDGIKEVAARGQDHGGDGDSSGSTSGDDGTRGRGAGGRRVSTTAEAIPAINKVRDRCIDLLCGISEPKLKTVLGAPHDMDGRTARTGSGRTLEGGADSGSSSSSSSGSSSSEYKQHDAGAAGMAGMAGIAGTAGTAGEGERGAGEVIVGGGNPFLGKGGNPFLGPSTPAHIEQDPTTAAGASTPTATSKPPSPPLHAGAPKAAAPSSSGRAVLGLPVGTVEEVLRRRSPTPLMLAVQLGFPAVVAHLLAQGELAVGAAKGWDKSPLQLALELGDSEVVTLLVEAGRMDAGVDEAALVNQRSEPGDTLLHIAARRDILEHCRLLVEHGAKVKIRGVCVCGEYGGNTTHRHESALDGTMDVR